MASIGNMQINVGEQKAFTDTITTVTSGVQDITNWLVTFTLHVVNDPGSVFLTKTVGSGITLTNPSQGVMTIQFNPSDTSGLRPGQYAYSIERTDVPLQLTVGLLTLGNP